MFLLLHSPKQRETTTEEDAAAVYTDQPTRALAEIRERPTVAEYVARARQVRRVGLVRDLRIGAERRVRAVRGRPQRRSTVSRAFPTPPGNPASHTHHHCPRAGVRAEMEGREGVGGWAYQKHAGAGGRGQRFVGAILGSVPWRIPRSTWGRQNNVQIRGSVGQFPSQFDLAQQSDSVRGTDLHDHLGVPRGVFLSHCNIILRYLTAF